MKEINAEGVKFIYDKDFVYNKLRNNSNIVMESDALQFVSKEDLVNICRPSIWNNIIRDSLYVKYLYWYKETELTELDKKVDIGLYTDADFWYSVNTYFVPKLLCQKCKHQYKSLVVHNIAFPMEWAFVKKKVDELREMGRQLNCPNCGTPFRILAVHLF